MIGCLIGVLFVVLVVVIVLYVCQVALAPFISLPPPAWTIIKLICGLIILLMLLNCVAGQAGFSGFSGFRLCG